MAPRNRFIGLIKRTELVALALFATIGVSLYLSGTVFAQTDPDYWQSYLDSQVAGITITATPGACGTGTIQVQWSAISQVDGYRISRDGSDVVYEGTSPSYTDTGLSAGSTHRYYLVAYKGSTSANTAATVSSTAPANCVQTTVAPPTNLSAAFNTTAGGIVLNWSQSSTYYGLKIMRRTGGGSFAQVGSLTASQATYTDTANLSPGTAYEYQVIGCTSAGCSNPSNTASASTPNSTTQTTFTAATTTTTTSPQPPSPATGFTAQFVTGEGKIALSWTNAGSVPVTSISIERRVLGATFAVLQTLSGSPTTYTDSSSLSPATTYEYRLISCNGAGNCATSGTVSATTPATSGGSATTASTGTSVTTSGDGTNNTTFTAPPAPVVSVIAPTGCGTFRLYLSWIGSAGASSYDIYRDNTLVTHTGGTSYADSDLPAGSQHSYRVAAKNSYGTTPSTAVSGTVPNACSTTATAPVQTQTATQPTPIAPVTTVREPVESAPASFTQTSAPGPAQVQRVPATREPLPVRTAVPPPIDPATLMPITPTTLPSTPSSPATPAQVQYVAEIQNVAESVSNTQAAVESARTALIESIDEHIDTVLRAAPRGGKEPDEKSIQMIRSQLINTIDLNLPHAGIPVADGEERLQSALKEGFAAIDKAASVDPAVPSGTQQTVVVAAGQFADVIEQASRTLQSTGAADVYKDTNRDGISDYDSVHLYHIDPVAPTPVTVVDGKKLTAGDKVLLGYDPTARELVALPREEPEVSIAPETTVYKVEEVKLTEKKQVSITGTALPNSYVTLYIYSTPIVVTVKTDRNGKWNYTVDRELETGEHKIYAASVDNTGKIVAKTVAIPFTKTAEAATLNNVPSLGAASVEKPSITNNRAIYPLIALSLLFIFGVLYLIGKDYLPQKPNSDLA